MEVTLLFAAILSAFMIVLAVRVLDLRGSPVTKSFHKPGRVIDPLELERAISCLLYTSPSPRDDGYSGMGSCG